MGEDFNFSICGSLAQSFFRLKYFVIVYDIFNSLWKDTLMAYSKKMDTKSMLIGAIVGVVASVFVPELYAQVAKLVGKNVEEL